MVNEFEVAGDPVLQAAFETTTHETTSPFAGLYVNVFEVVAAP